MTRAASNDPHAPPEEPPMNATPHVEEVEIRGHIIDSLPAGGVVQ